MSPIEKLLGVVSHPNVAYILFLLGLVGLYFELSTPGAILPGVVGGISLLLALYAFSVLPVNLAGLGLILFAHPPLRRRDQGRQPRPALAGRSDRPRGRVPAALLREGRRGRATGSTSASSFPGSRSRSGSWAS